MKRWKILLLTLFLVLAGCMEPEQVSGPKVDPIDYIVKEGLGNNLSSFARRASRKTQTYRIIESKLGDTEANRVVGEELALSIEEHQDEWNRNLAKAYSELLTIEEINSLYYNGKRSQYYDKRLKLLGEIGKSMQVKSKSLLIKVVSESMQRAFERVSPQ